MKMYLRNKIDFAKAILFAHLFNKRTPLNVMWRITNKCTSLCKYCTIPLRSQKELSIQQILGLINQMAEAGTQRIGFVGGEPLCRKDIEKIIDRCKKNNIYVTLVSNGFYIRERISEIKNLDFLILSLDGDKKAHEKNRQKGSYDRVIQAIKIARKYIPIMTNTVLNKDNQSSIDFILALSKKYSFIPHFNVIQGISSHIPRDNYYLCIKKLILKKKQGYNIANSYNLLNYWLSWEDFSKNMVNYKRRNFPKCWAGKLMCNIDTDGRMGHCDLRNNTGQNVLKRGFKKAFYNLKDIDCKSCTCANLVEYNYIYSLNVMVAIEWIKVINKGFKNSL